MPYNIQSATPGDLSELVNIFEHAFNRDRMTQIKARARPVHERSQYVRDLIRPPLIEWLDPSSRSKVVLCAVDTASEKICGWICWGFKSLSDEDVLVSLPAERTAEDCSKAAQFRNKPAELEWPGSDIDQSKIIGIEKASSASMQDWLAKMERTKHMFVGCICVLPPYQHQGLGWMLLDWGTKIADTASVPTWVHSAEDAYATFAAAGFEEQRNVTFDLHNLGDEVTDLRPYIYRFMLRKPQT